MEIKINSNIKLEDVESLYEQLYSTLDENSKIDVLLPKEIKNSYLGLIPLLYQFVITWIRKQESGKLLLNVDEPLNDEIVDKLYENELLFPLISLVWNKNEVYEKKGVSNLRNQLRKKNVEVFDKMKRVKALKGNKLLLTNFDHLPEDRGLLPCFEINNEFIKDESTLADSLRDALSELLSYSNLAKNIFHNVFKDIVGVIYELMKNTYEWARSDENKIALDPNLRGILIKFYKKKRDTFLKESEEHKSLVQYFANELFKENTKGELYFLEVSVFDSGIGFIDKYRSLNIDGSTMTAIEILKKCLIKHMTSAKGLGKDDKGIGLDRILSLLDRKGFLKIRTGALSVYRNLVTHEYKSVDSIGNMELFDWFTCNNEDYTTCQNAAGTVITIIYPLSIPYTQTLPFNE